MRPVRRSGAVGTAIAVTASAANSGVTRTGTPLFVGMGAVGTTAGRAGTAACGDGGCRNRQHEQHRQHARS